MIRFTMLPLVYLLLSAVVSASPLLFSRQSVIGNNSTNSTSPSLPSVSVSLPNSSVTVVGNHYPAFNQDVFLGIPFAQPPVGPLRFAPPQRIEYNASNTTIIAKTQTPACPQIPDAPIAGAFGVSEDCLTLNIYRPTGVNASTPTKLPVMVWIHGGGFDEGTTATYNGTALVAQSVIQTTPIVFVAIQYRVAIWGWAQGAQATANNATNLGLRDQIAALQWVQENIAAFGGDKEKVTLVGQSAGAISIALHYLNPTFVSNANSSSGTNTTSSFNSTTNNATTTPSLFRGAIMQSGAMSTYPIANSTTSRQEIFDEIANLTGCTANVTSGPNVTVGSAAYNQSLWDCVKFVNNETLLNATVQVLQKPENQFGNFIFGPSIDGVLVTASPAALIANGSFLKVPFISGNVKDEGTEFFPPMADTTAELEQFVDLAVPSPPNDTVISTLLSFYPDVASGSPFDTGNNTFGLSPLWKIGSALVGDVQFQAPRRDFLRRSTEHGLNHTWSYQFEQNLNTSSPAGVYHGSDVAFVFGAYSAGNITSPLSQLGQQMIAYWLNFVNYLDPNGNSTNPASAAIQQRLNLTTWPSYTTSTNGGNQNMLRLQANNLTVFQDTYRQGPIFYINSVPEALNH